jgi:hypothetical protein
MNFGSVQHELYDVLVVKIPSVQFTLIRIGLSAQADFSNSLKCRKYSDHYDYLNKRFNLCGWYSYD